MENPTFHLEGVVRTREDMEDFEGPLTLILQLLSKNKIEIQDIRIAELTDQYLSWLEERKALDLDVASEFVQMASYLVYIKARMLLSAGEETGELEELIGSLERLKNKALFEQLQKVLPELGEMYTRGAGTLTKPPEYLPVDKEYRYFHVREDLSEAMARVLSREDAAAAYRNPPGFRYPERIVYSVTEKTKQIVALLTAGGPMSLRGLFAKSGSRTELVATFIALLELCREGDILLDGDGGDASVSLNGERTS